MEPVVSFVYQLLRDHLPAGVVSRLIDRAVDRGVGDANPELEVIARHYAALLTRDLL